jgi:hypothetical protein
MGIDFNALFSCLKNESADVTNRIANTMVVE